MADTWVLKQKCMRLSATFYLIPKTAGGYTTWPEALPALKDRLGSLRLFCGDMIRGIAALEKFIYEIMLLCLVMTLTSLHELRKIRGIQKQKEKRLTPSLP